MPFDGKLPAKPGGVAATLIKAKEIQQHRGWCQDRYRDDVGRRCPSRSIKEAVDVADGNYALLCAAVDGFMRPLNIHYIPGWNDAKDRTYDQVLAAFDNAIDDALVAEAV